MHSTLGTLDDVIESCAWKHTVDNPLPFFIVPIGAHSLKLMSKESQNANAEEAESQKVRYRVGDVAQSEESLPYMHRSLGSIPSTIKQQQQQNQA